MSRHSLFMALFLALVTFIVFAEVRNHQFLWDDDSNITANPYLNPVTLPNVLQFWQRSYGRLYIPLTYTVWGAVARLSDPATQNAGPTLRPRPFHIANLIFHTLSVLVVFAILRLLVANDWGSCCGAFLFALHPVQVESVAWVTGLKDILCGFLSLTAIWQYLLYAKSTPLIDHSSSAPGSSAPKRDEVTRPLVLDWHYTLATLAFLLALLAKPTAICVPLMVWMLDRWILGRPIKQSGFALAGWFAASVSFIIITKLVQPDLVTSFTTPLWARLLVAGDSLVFYLSKLVFPLWLAPDYGRTPQRVLNQTWIYFSWIAPLGLGIIAWFWRYRWPLLLASFGIFIVGVLPVAGIVPFDFQRVSTVADRYLYLSMLGPALAASCVIAAHSRIFTVLSCALVLSLLGIASASQTRHWRDANTLFAYALTVNPQSSLAHNNLGNALVARHELDAAVRHYRQALNIDPVYPFAHNNLANVLFMQGELEEAIGHFQQALQINPAYAKAHYNLGIALAQRGELEAAIEHFRSALTVEPSYAKVHYNLGVALAKRGELNEAAYHFRTALDTDPENAAAHEALARTLAQQGKKEQAAHHYQEALRILKSRSERSGSR